MISLGCYTVDKVVECLDLCGLEIIALKHTHTHTSTHMHAHCYSTKLQAQVTYVAVNIVFVCVCTCGGCVHASMHISLPPPKTSDRGSGVWVSGCKAFLFKMKNM